MGVLIASLIAHVLLLIAILFVRTKSDDGAPPSGPQVAMVFETPGAASPAGQKQAEPTPGRSAPTPNETPDPKAQTPSSAAAEPQMNIEPELNLPALSAPPPVPQPPSDAAALPRPSLPRPRPRAKAHAASPFSSPMAFSFGPQSGPPPGHSGRGGINMGFSVPAPTREGPTGASSGGLDVRQTAGPALGRDWFGQLDAWWRQHRFYPNEAAERGEDGTVSLQIVVDPYGKVQAVAVQTRSGSMWLDSGALSIFRNAKLPPFPPGAEGGNATIDLNINYILVRH